MFITITESEVYRNWYQSGYCDGLDCVAFMPWNVSMEEAGEFLSFGLVKPLRVQSLTGILEDDMESK